MGPASPIKFLVENCLRPQQLSQTLFLFELIWFSTVKPPDPSCLLLSLSLFTRTHKHFSRAGGASRPQICVPSLCPRIATPRLPGPGKGKGGESDGRQGREKRGGAGRGGRPHERPHRPGLLLLGRSRGEQVLASVSEWAQCEVGASLRTGRKFRLNVCF